MSKALTTKEISRISIFTAITAILAQIVLPLPFTPMPISFGLVAVYITGIILKPKHAVFVQLCYLLIGAVGVPVYGNFRGGVGALFGPTGGYLMMYPLMAWVVSFALNSRQSRQLENKQNKKWLFAKAGISISIAHILLYIGGTTWLCFTTGSSFAAALALAVYPFIPLDILKIVFCVVAILPLRIRMLANNMLLLDDASPSGLTGERK